MVAHGQGTVLPVRIQTPRGWTGSPVCSPGDLQLLQSGKRGRKPQGRQRLSRSPAGAGGGSGRTPGWEPRLPLPPPTSARPLSPGGFYLEPPPPPIPKLSSWGRHQASLPSYSAVSSHSTEPSNRGASQPAEPHRQWPRNSLLAPAPWEAHRIPWRLAGRERGRGLAE